MTTPADLVRGWVSLILAVGSYAGFLIGVHVYDAIRVDIVTGWDYALALLETAALLLGRDARDTGAGRAGMYVAGIILFIEITRIPMVLAWPGHG